MEITYKGYIANLQFSPYTDSFFGEVVNSPDLMTFQVNHPGQAMEALQATVERYLSHIEIKRTECIS